MERIRPVGKVKPCSTSGNQACMGANPNFRASAIEIIVRGRGWAICEISH